MDLLFLIHITHISCLVMPECSPLKACEDKLYQTSTCRDAIDGVSIMFRFPLNTCGNDSFMFLHKCIGATHRQLLTIP